MNNVVLIGRLTKDPELAYTPSQTAVCKFNLAVDRPKRDGQDQGADFIRITVWGKTAENCDKYLSKGSKIGIVGRIQTGNYKDKDGKTIYTTDVVAENVEFLGGGSGDNKTTTKDAPKEEPKQTSFDDMPDSFAAADDQIPF